MNNILYIKDHYSINNNTVIRTHEIVIPPESGDRIDILCESNKYYYNIENVKKFKKEHPFENISIVIDIKQGNITLIGTN